MPGTPNQSCVAANTSVGYLLEVGKKWGIFAAILCAGLTFFGWFHIQLYQDNVAQSEFIQTELMDEIKENIVSRTELNVTLKQTNEVLQQNTNVLKEFIPQKLTSSQGE